MLESRTSALASSAHWSLTRVCDVDNGKDPQAWREWREREKAWWEANAQARLEDLYAEEPGIVLQSVAELLRHPLVGGVILFARNYADPVQLAALTREIHALREPRLLIAVDHPLKTIAVSIVPIWWLCWVNAKTFLAVMSVVSPG